MTAISGPWKIVRETVPSTRVSDILTTYRREDFMKRSVVLAFLLLAVAFVGSAFAEMTVDEAVACTSVADRKAEGAASSFPADVGRVFAYTKIKGGAEGASITHRWIYAEKTVAEVKFPVKASPWRVWSSKGIAPAQTGAWKVEIADDAGKVLKTVEFTVGGETPAKEPAAPKAAPTAGEKPAGEKSAK